MPESPPLVRRAALGQPAVVERRPGAGAPSRQKAWPARHPPSGATTASEVPVWLKIVGTAGGILVAGLTILGMVWNLAMTPVTARDYGLTQRTGYCGPGSIPALPPARASRV
ncbi:hypothetical protein [Roseomonas chloroacetimidivorans]|jgi:hypothetical protein|uniref:hypothetical protein n=1 Tax=Roseomonas chloroacetimidivorans TaxID=1766656 RepID=UPI003C781F67